MILLIFQQYSKLELSFALQDVVQNLSQDSENIATRNFSDLKSKLVIASFKTDLKANKAQLYPGVFQVL